jgi:hypothetical protein
MLKLTLMSIGILQLPGSEEIILYNSYNEKIDVSWFPIFTTILSAIGILLGGLWIVQPIVDKTNWWTGKLSFLPIFFYRMIAWQIIIITLESFSVIVCLVFISINCLVLYLAQKKLTLEPISSSCLAIVFPMYKLPSINIEAKVSLKILFWLIVCGNSLLLFVYISILLLHYFDLYNPWCSGRSEWHLFSEDFFTKSTLSMVILFLSATIPSSTVYILTRLRFVLLKLLMM